MSALKLLRYFGIPAVIALTFMIVAHVIGLPAQGSVGVGMATFFITIFFIGIAVYVSGGDDDE